MENIDAPDVLPVILGGDIGAYSLARAFHEAYGIMPLVLSQADCHMCGDSSILVNRVVPHLERPAVLLSTLANTAERFGNRPLLLLGCGDWYVRLIVENRAVLEKSFIIPYIGEDLLNRLTEKDRFYALCAEVGVPVPRTVVFDASADGDDPASVTLPFPFPVVAKPASSAAYHYADFAGKQKVFFLRDATELRATLAAVQSSRYEGKLLIQETIPGDDTSMRILTTYSDQNGKVRFASFGQTLLEDMRPMGVGNPLAIVSRTDETIVTEAARLLEAVGYTGFANFDIKVDPRDGSHYFFEINTRLGRSNYYVTAAGDNAARWLMDDLVLGRPLPEGLTVARGESLYTVAPKAILLDYIRDDALRREVRGCTRSAAMPIRWTIRPRRACAGACTPSSSRSANGRPAGPPWRISGPGRRRRRIWKAPGPQPITARRGLPPAKTTSTLPPPRRSSRWQTGWRPVRKRHRERALGRRARRHWTCGHGLLPAAARRAHRGPLRPGSRAHPRLQRHGHPRPHGISAGTK